MIAQSKLILGLVMLAACLTCSDGLAQCLRKLQPQTALPGDRTGWSVAIDGDYAVIGAKLASVNGPGSGAVYVYQRIGATWTQTQRLLPTDGTASQQFGCAVAISGETILVGAWGDNGLGPNAGAAYIFRRNGPNWVQEQRLVASDGHGGDLFGCSVSIAGDIAIIGSFGNGEAGSNRGAAYLFQDDGANWRQKQKLFSWGSPAMWFGKAVAASDQTIVIGALDGENGPQAGAAYVFRRNGATWQPQQKLLAPDGAALDLFGSAVATAGDVIVVGSPEDDDVASNSGSVHIFRSNGASWIHEQKLITADAGYFNRFGSSVSIAGEIIAIGASSAAADRGSAYLFRRNGAAWTQLQKLVPADGIANDWFGCSVALSDTTAIIGACQNPPGFTSGPGAAYILESIDHLGSSAPDCNNNGIPDICDIASGYSADTNGNSIPDECEQLHPPCPADVNGDHTVNVTDLLVVLNQWGRCVSCEGDINHDGFVNVADLLALIGAWGRCP